MALLFYLNLLHCTKALLHSTMFLLHSTRALLHTMHLTLLHSTMVILHSTSLYHGYTSLYFSLLHSTTALLHSTSLYHGYTSLFLTFYQDVILPCFYLTLFHSTLAVLQFATFLGYSHSHFRVFQLPHLTLLSLMLVQTEDIITVQGTSQVVRWFQVVGFEELAGRSVFT